MNTYIVSIDGTEHEVKVLDDKNFVLNGLPVEINIERLDERTFSILIEGSSQRVVVERNGSGYQILVDGSTIDTMVESERARLLKKFDIQNASKHIKTEIRAPMPALVVKVEVEVGQEVAQGQGLVILEAMKMENEIKAHSAGTVKQVLVTKGTAVEKGELLILLE